LSCSDVISSKKRFNDMHNFPCFSDKSALILPDLKKHQVFYPVFVRETGKNYH